MFYLIGIVIATALYFVGPFGWVIGAGLLLGAVLDLADRLKAVEVPNSSKSANGFAPPEGERERIQARMDEYAKQSQEKP